MQSQSQPIYQLVIQDGDRRFSVILEAPMYTIGRDVLCSIRLQSSYVSRCHATFWHQQDDQGEIYYQIVDGDGADRPSRNGLIVNSVRVQSHRLKLGDQISLGPDVHLTYGVSHTDLERLVWDESYFEISQSQSGQTSETKTGSVAKQPPLVESRTPIPEEYLESSKSAWSPYEVVNLRSLEPPTRPVDPSNPLEMQQLPEIYHRNSPNHPQDNLQNDPGFEWVESSNFDADFDLDSNPDVSLGLSFDLASDLSCDLIQDANQNAHPDLILDPSINPKDLRQDSQVANHWDPSRNPAMNPDVMESIPRENSRDQALPVDSMAAAEDLDRNSKPIPGLDQKNPTVQPPRVSGLDQAQPSISEMMEPSNLDSSRDAQLAEGFPVPENTPMPENVRSWGRHDRVERSPLPSSPEKPPEHSPVFPWIAQLAQDLATDVVEELAPTLGHNLGQDLSPSLQEKLQQSLKQNLHQQLQEKFQQKLQENLDNFLRQSSGTSNQPRHNSTSWEEVLDDYLQQALGARSLKSDDSPLYSDSPSLADLNWKDLDKSVICIYPESYQGEGDDHVIILDKSELYHLLSEKEADSPPSPP